MSDAGRGNRTGGRSSRGGSGRNRSGRGRKGQFGSSPRTNKKKELADYVYYLGSAKQASDYETTTEYLINHIKGTFHFGEDIGSALANLEPYDIDKHQPTLKISTATDTDLKQAETRQYDMIFKAELDAYMKRKQYYEVNFSKAYAFLWEHCAKSMQIKIEARKDYTKIKGDPIKLLEAIKQHALNYQENRYEMSIILDALTTSLNMRQRENESLHDYTK
jgi:hypothetical protein